MQFGPVNGWAIGAAVLSYFVVGGLWYSPLLFVNSWLELAHLDKQIFDAGLPRALLGDLFAALATALALNQVIRWSGATSVQTGLLVAAMVWVGFMASVLISQVTYEHRPLGFFAISAAYRLVMLLGMGAILSAWR